MDIAQRVIKRLAIQKQAQTEEKQFIWITASGTWLIPAETMDEAYTTALENRMKSGGQTQEEAISSFHKDDQLLEIDGSLESLWSREQTYSLPESFPPSE